MKKKIDYLLAVIYCALLFYLFFLPYLTSIWFYVYLDDETASLFLNINCLLSIILCVCFLINIIIIPFCKWIHEKERRNKNE